MNLFWQTLFPGRQRQIAPTLYWLYNQFPLPKEAKKNFKNYILWRFPFVRKTLFSGLKDKWICDESAGVMFSLLRTPPEDDVWVLIAEQRISLTDKDHGSARLNAVISIFLDVGFRITLISSFRKTQCDADLIRKGISAFYGVDEALNHLIEEGYKYKIAFLTHPEAAFEFNPLVRAYAINAEVIYAAADLHGLHFENDGCLQKNAGKLNKMTRINIECSDRVIVRTEEDKEKVLALSPDKKVDIISVIYSTALPDTALAKRYFRQLAQP